MSAPSTSSAERIKQNCIKENENICEKINENGDGFVQLHFHDEYSIRDALGKIEDYVSLIKERNLKTFSVTNHGSIGGFVRQYNLCKKLNIKPIFGCEIYINDLRNKEKSSIEKVERKNKHMCIYVKNQIGFKNICKITSDAWINGFYYKPRTDYEFLKQNSSGLIASSACLASVLSDALNKDNYDEAKNILEKYKNIFEEFYIELLLIDYEPQKIMNNKLAKLAKITETKTIITNDVHYMNKEYFEVHDTMILIRDNKTFEEIKNDPQKDSTYKVKDLYYKNQNEMYDSFKNGHESEYFTEDLFYKSIENINNIVNSIENIEIDNCLKLPKFAENSDEIFKQKIFQGLKDRNLFDNKEYYDKAIYEYDIISKNGYIDYFLIMQDIMMWAKNNNIYCGAGRGSAAGSLVSYLLRITEIDPIRYGLLFERFMSLGRTGNLDCPDIDNDFEPSGRDFVKKYMIERFGQDKICTIGSYGCYKARGTLLDVSRAYSVPLDETFHITKNIMTSECDDMTFEEIRNEFPAMKEYFEKYPKIFEKCNIIRGQIRNISKHAAGVIVSDRVLADNIPLIQTDGNICSAWQDGADYREMSSLGYVKLDILGLNNLTVIKDCINLIKQRHGVEFDFYNWKDMNHKGAFELASNADTYGVFQFESRLSMDVLKKVKVDSFLDLSHISSLLRPGPLRMGMDNLFAKRKNKLEEYEIHPTLKNILGETYGVVIYQEQIMLIAQQLANFSQEESNKFRKILVKYGKGSIIELQKAQIYKDKFFENVTKILGEKHTEELWNNIAKFAEYGFNRAHAVSYAYVSYVQLWLKANYFIEFMVSLLNNTQITKENNQDDNVLKIYINYLRRKGIEVLGPDINLSEQDFSILSENKIIYGLRNIKNITNKSEQIISKKPYKSLQDFCDKNNKGITELNNSFLKKRVITKSENVNTNTNINKTKIESLIYSGAFDSLGDRNELIELYNIKINKNKKYEKIIYTEKELIEKELDVIKICLSRKSIDENILSFIEKNNFSTPIGAIENKNDNITVVGILSKIITNKIKSGKNIGNNYYRISIMDDYDKISLNIFNSKDIEYIDKIFFNKIGSIIIIKDISLHQKSGLWNTNKKLKDSVEWLND